MAITLINHPIPKTYLIYKRGFDIICALVGLIVLLPVILLAWIAATISSGENGIFRQNRVGREGRCFKVNKLKTMRKVEGFETSITTDHDPRITTVGRLLRKTKLDELPQLWNVLIGEMSFVGPRPDVPGYADKLQGDDRLMLTIRPGITGPATIKYTNEEEILAKQDAPETYNQDVIWPDKVRINLDYIRHYHPLTDLKLIWKTVYRKR